MNEPRKNKIVFSMRLAAELQRKGNVLIERIPNIEKPEFDIFVFENSEKVRIDMNDFFKRRAEITNK